jgi:hypothetical protein
MVIKILTDSKPDKYVERSGLITFVFVFIGILTLLPQIGMAIAGIAENSSKEFLSNGSLLYVGWAVAILYQFCLIVLVARCSSKINHLQHALIDTQRWAWDVNERIEALETAE